MFSEAFYSTCLQRAALMLVYKYKCHGVSLNVCVNIWVLNFNVCQVVCLGLMPNWLRAIVTRCVAKDVLTCHVRMWHHFEGLSDVAFQHDVIKTKAIKGWVMMPGGSLTCLLMMLVGCIWIFRWIDWLWAVQTSWCFTREAAPHSFHVNWFAL